MRRALFFLIIGMSFLVSSVSFAETPHEIAGIALGANIKENPALFKTDSALPLRHMPYLSEMEVKPSEGFRAGYIYYGNCSESGRIVRVRLKYERADKEFFDELLERFKKEFGTSCEYRGDAFRAFIAWKWTFTDKDQNRITLQLQHNSEDGDEDVTRGNSVKMTAVNLIENERMCYEEKHPETRENGAAPSGSGTKQPVDFNRFIPR